MGTKYARDLVTVKTKQTLTVEPYFFIARSDDDMSPLQIVGETSRFRVTIINESRQALTARWTVKEMRKVKNNLSDARKFVNFIKWAKTFGIMATSSASNNLAAPIAGSGDSKAYSVRFVMGNGLKGKTPAEVYAEDPSGFEQKMRKQYDFIAGNIGKNGGKYDETNKTQMEAISDALNLLKNGSLKSDTAQHTAQIGEIEILKPTMKPLIREKDERTGLCPVYSTSITVYPDKTYPVEIKITNFQAPVEKLADGRLNVKASVKQDEKINKMSLSFEDAENMLQEMEDYVQEFKALHAKQCFSDSEKCIRENMQKKTETDTQKTQSSDITTQQKQTVQTKNGNYIHVKSISPVEKDNSGNYCFTALKDNGECIDIRISNEAAEKMGTPVFRKFVEKTNTRGGADFCFTGSKRSEKGKIVYLFYNFARTNR